MEVIMVDFKVAIINRTGKINMLKSEYKFHADCLLGYARKNYSDYEIFKKLSYRHSPEVISFFFLELLGDIVFLNTSSKRDANIDILLLPTTLFKEQEDSLLQFLEHIKDFKIGLCTDLKIEQGILEARETYSVNNEAPRELVLNYLKNNGPKRG